MIDVFPITKNYKKEILEFIILFYKITLFLNEILYNNASIVNLKYCEKFKKFALSNFPKIIPHKLIKYRFNKISRLRM